MPQTAKSCQKMKRECFAHKIRENHLTVKTTTVNKASASNFCLSQMESENGRLM